MAKTATLTTIAAGYGSYSQHNTNYSNINTALSNTLSLDGSTPNSMLADFDLNSYDLLNGGTLNATDIVIGGISLAAQVAAAAASATAAAASATAAAASAVSAAASYDSFDDIYLGAKSSDPSVDNDGDALQTGALYYNTTDGVLKIWTGSAWANLQIPTSFTDLGDVPSSYSGQALKFLRVNAGETALEFTASSATVGDADYGDITVSSTGTVWTIDNNAVTLAKMATGTQGGVLYYGAGGAIAERAAGTSGQVLVTSGAGFNPQWSEVDGRGIRMGSDAQGDILYFNGTNYVRLGAGTSGQFLKTQGAGANPTWDDPTGGGTGAVAQIKYSITATEASTSSLIPYDNTIPQSTEGVQITTVSITATNASSTFLVEGVVSGGTSTNGVILTAACFVDSATSAFGATGVEGDSNVHVHTFPFMFTYSPGDTSAHTIKLRAGPSTGTFYVNRSQSNGSKYSTAGPVCSLKVTEILP